MKLKDQSSMSSSTEIDSFTTIKRARTELSLFRIMQLWQVNPSDYFASPEDAEANIIFIQEKIERITEEDEEFMEAREYFDDFKTYFWTHDCTKGESTSVYLEYFNRITELLNIVVEEFEPVTARSVEYIRRREDLSACASQALMLSGELEDIIGSCYQSLPDDEAQEYGLALEKMVTMRRVLPDKKEYFCRILTEFLLFCDNPVARATLSQFNKTASIATPKYSRSEQIDSYKLYRRELLAFLVKQINCDTESIYLDELSDILTKLSMSFNANPRTDDECVQFKLYLSSSVEYVERLKLNEDYIDLIWAVYHSLTDTVKSNQVEAKECDVSSRKRPLDVTGITFFPPEKKKMTISFVDDYESKQRLFFCQTDRVKKTALVELHQMIKSMSDAQYTDLNDFMIMQIRAAGIEKSSDQSESVFKLLCSLKEEIGHMRPVRFVRHEHQSVNGMFWRAFMSSCMVNRGRPMSECKSALEALYQIAWQDPKVMAVKEYLLSMDVLVDDLPLQADEETTADISFIKWN